MITFVMVGAAILVPLSYSFTHTHAQAAVTPSSQVQTDLPYPSWWNGTACDTKTVSNSAPLKANYRGVPACGPIGLPADTAHEVVFPGGWGEYEWQCVELSMRFMYLAYGIVAYSANGNQVVDNYTNPTYNPHNYNNPILQPVTNDGSSKTAPQAGDILSYSATSSFGHTSVVTASNVDSTGNGTITILEQNFSPTGGAVLKVGANANKPPWVIGGSVTSWLHHSVDLTPQSAPASAGVTVSGSGFAANEKVHIYIDSTLLSIVTATGNGTVSTPIIVPATASLGAHRIRLVGQTSNFTPKTVLYVVNASPPPAGTITEIPLPTANSGAMGIVSGPDGNLWFTEPGTKIGRITSYGLITEFPLPSNMYRSGIASGPDGNLWITEVSSYSIKNKIARITPTGVITEFSVPTAKSAPYFIASGPDGNLWFTETNGNKIGRITTSGVITEFPVPPTAYPALGGITSGPDGNLWFTEQSTSEIDRITPTGTITEFPLPAANSNPLNITPGSDGNLWFTEYYGNKIGRITPSGVITEFPLPTANSGAYDIVSGRDGNLWFTENSTNHIARITPQGNITEFPMPTSNSQPLCITAGPDGNLWFTEQNQGNNIGRIIP